MWEILRDPLIISSISSITTMIAVFSYYFLYYRKLPIVIVLKKHQGVLQKVKSLRVKPTDEHFVLGKKAYVLNWEKASYLNKGTPVLFYFEGKTEPVEAFNPTQLKNSEVTDKAYLLFKKEVFRQLIEASKPLIMNWGLTILLVVLGVGLGFGLGYILYPHITPSPTPIQNATQSSPPVIPTP